MARKVIKRWFPDLHLVKKYKSLHLFGDILHNPNLWHLNRRSVAGAFAVGLFTAFMPVPFQMIMAAAVAMVFRVNLPISVLLVWISNPITIAPIFYTAYKVGKWVLGEPPGAFHFEPTLDWFFTEFSEVWQPLLTGCFLMGSSASLLGYASIRLYWRYYVVRMLEKRRRRRLSSQKIN